MADWSDYAGGNPTFIEKLLLFVARLFKPNKQSLSMLPAHNDLVDIGPYRAAAVLSDKRSDKVDGTGLFVIFHNGWNCPICGVTALSKNSKGCTPFSRIIIKRKLFNPNIKCRLVGVHEHLTCRRCNCKWIYKFAEPKFTELLKNDLEPEEPT